MNLQNFRREIDSIDDEILGLLEKRMEIVKRIGKAKLQSNTPIYRPEREKESLIDCILKALYHSIEQRLRQFIRRFLQSVVIWNRQNAWRILVLLEVIRIKRQKAGLAQCVNIFLTIPLHKPSKV